MRARAASLLIAASVCTAIVATTVLAGCNDDGRTLRDPRPDQQGSVSTTAAPSTTSIDPNFPDQFDPGAIETELVDLDAATTPALDEVVLAPWVNGGTIPDRNTCNGLDIAPALTWSPAPTGTVEIAITLVDQDSPEFVHWVMAGIDPFATTLNEGIIPEFATVGLNSNGQAGYAGPCPPAGTTHTYVLTVHFLDQQTELGDGTAGVDLQGFVNGATFESVSVTGTYSQG